MSEIAAVSVTSITSRAGSTPCRSRRRSRWASIVASVTDSAERFTAIAPAQQHLRRDARRPRRPPGARRTISRRPEQRQHLLEDHPVDVADQPVALGRRQEVPGGDQRAVRFVGEAQQRLVVGDAPSLQRDDRLEVQHEQLVLQRAPQAREPRAPVQARGRAEARGQRARGDGAAHAAARRGAGRPAAVRGGLGGGRAQHPRECLRRRRELTCLRTLGASDARPSAARRGRSYGRRARSETTSSSATSTKFITTEEPP